MDDLLKKALAVEDLGSVVKPIDDDDDVGDVKTPSVNVKKNDEPPNPPLKNDDPPNPPPPPNAIRTSLNVIQTSLNVIQPCHHAFLLHQFTQLHSKSQKSQQGAPMENTAKTKRTSHHNSLNFIHCHHSPSIPPIVPLFPKRILVGPRSMCAGIASCFHGHCFAEARVIFGL